MSADHLPGHTPATSWSGLWDPLVPPAEILSLEVMDFYRELEVTSRYNRSILTRLHLRPKHPTPVRRWGFRPSIPGQFPGQQLRLFDVPTGSFMPNFGARGQHP